MWVTSPLKLSLNYDLCFIFLKSQKSIFEPLPAANICYDLSILLNLLGISYFIKNGYFGMCGLMTKNEDRIL
jgi:hypothetical protein